METRLPTLRGKHNVAEQSASKCPDLPSQDKNHSEPFHRGDTSLTIIIAPKMEGSTVSYLAERGSETQCLHPEREKEGEREKLE